ncbi:MAG TPA: hypothetical protein VGF45_17690 [Polyangia bacterium]
MSRMQHHPRSLLLLAVFAVIGCRFGGPQAGDAAIDAASPSTPPVEDTAPAPPLQEVAPPVEVQPPPLPPVIDAADDRAPAADSGIAACGAPFPVQVCDPVCNSGCAALLRCDVSDVPQTGACVGIWIGQVGDACFKGTGTDSCAAGLTCLEGKCAKLCHSTGDCPTAGTCCTRELEGSQGKLGFKVCAPC